MADFLIEGHVDDRFLEVRELFEQHFADGSDVGASFCATIAGRTVVDLWGGWADAERTRRWERDTIVNVYSSTKTMSALVALILADQGALDFDAPVARYWPEFAASGKAAITVAQVMSHTTGLSGWREPVAPDDIYDWEKLTTLLAAQEPFWKPGTASGYHGYTQGYLIGEIVRRITGRTIGTYFREEIAEPLGADFHIGLAPEHDPRVADLIPFPPDQIVAHGEPSEFLMNQLINPRIDPMDTRTRAWRAAEIPAAGGHGNARSIAQIHVILANGGVAQGKRFLSEEGCRKALELQIEGDDLVMGVPARLGMGFGLSGTFITMPNPNSIFWGGYGGSMAIIDMDARASFGYAMNKMAQAVLGDPRGMSMIESMWRTLGAA